ncbi:hypothetical protein Solca_2302 [Solitalea canadensis DSM 3403]|uniref:Uncharacterized protein n=1 Tax=Solitalea canadensis (strain ATCC 29591 / DSM 3403 / JCM 21819 / LMG 8368 / NBRC 15130 / NCIMB 12057 / USAM 9D) TaxID=929556 RepID=H8KUH9_SOLCM|nr:hypothetical protein Solca_2302 [Solitalea canadensis DSM 3403]
MEKLSKIAKWLFYAETINEMWMTVRFPNNCYLKSN